MEIASAEPPVWKYQRQFEYAEGVSTLEQRPSLLQDAALTRLSDEQVRTVPIRLAQTATTCRRLPVMSLLPHTHP